MTDASYTQVTGKLDLINRQDAIEALDACCVKYNISPNYDDKRTNKEKFYDWWDMYKVLSMQIINDLPSAQPEERTKERAETHACDFISRQAAIDAIGKSLYEYEDRTEKQFQDSDELDVEDWIQHRIFVQNMSDIDRQTIMDLPSAQPEQRWIPCSERLPEESGRYLVSVLDGVGRRTTVAPYQPRYKAWTMTGRMAYWKVIAWMPLPEPYRAER